MDNTLQSECADRASTERANGISRMGWLMVGSIIGGLGGFVAGQAFEDSNVGLHSVAANEQSTSPDYKEVPEAASLVNQYRQEVVRLKQQLEGDEFASREKELTLQAMVRRGMDLKSPSCQRMNRDVSELTESIAHTERQLLDVQRQLAELTAVRNANERHQDGLDRQLEIDAHRVILEHDAGLSHE